MRIPLSLLVGGSLLLGAVPAFGAELSPLSERAMMERNTILKSRLEQVRASMKSTRMSSDRALPKGMVRVNSRVMDRAAQQRRNLQRQGHKKCGETRGAERLTCLRKQRDLAEKALAE